MMTKSLDVRGAKLQETPIMIYCILKVFWQWIVNQHLYLDVKVLLPKLLRA